MQQKHAVIIVYIHPGASRRYILRNLSLPFAIENFNDTVCSLEIARADP